MMLGATSANAEAQFYIGGGLGISDAITNPRIGDLSQNEGVLGGLGLTAGLRFDSGALFFGPELDMDVNLFGDLKESVVDLSCADGYASGLYYCSQNATIRFRGVVGADLGPFEVFGTLGYAMMFGNVVISGDGSSAPGSSGGLTFGAGIQRQVGNGVLRVEYIRDQLLDTISTPNSSISQTWEAGTVKVTYTINTGDLAAEVENPVTPGLSFYGGGGLAFGFASSAAIDDPMARTNNGMLTGLSATIGARYDTPALFFGAEVDVDFPVAGNLEDETGSCAVTGANDSYFCSQNATARLRGVVGKNIGRFDIFGTLGYGIMHGNGAIGRSDTEIGVTGGITYGAGIQYAMGNGKLRFEYVHDNFTNIIVRPNDQYEPIWRADIIKVSYILSF